MALALTLGDPDGLGPELACRLLPDLPLVEPLILIGPESALSWHLERRKAEPFWVRLNAGAEQLDCQGLDPAVYLLVPEELENYRPKPGAPRPEAGRAAGLSLAKAVELAMAGEIDGIVTLPLNKAMLQAAGYDFPGHTEFLAEGAGLAKDQVTMHLCGRRLRVSLVTTHPALREVPDLITRERVLRTIAHTAALVRELELPGPVAVCGLNPHAGESGAIGREEIEIIGPAVEEAKAQGLDIIGPMPADTLFHHAAQGAYAAVVAMYHDQGLGPLKTLEFTHAVNVTLGLPFIRTSVDHGTAYDLTGRDEASTGSLQAALDLALELSRRRRAHVSGH